MYAVVTSQTQVKVPTPDDAKELKHHPKAGRKEFVNPWESWQEPDRAQLLSLFLWRKFTGKGSVDTKPPHVAVRKPVFLESRKTPALRATWLGHACYYVEFPSGLRVLFDPVFEPRCSPFSFVGPKRYTDPPCALEDIPIVDAVIISHNHYDHLSLPSVQKLKELHPNAHFFVPLRNKQWFLASGIENVTELDWWQSRDIKLSKTHFKSESSSPRGSVALSIENNETEYPSEISATISCLPCQHMTGRGIHDQKHTLWASWSVKSGDKSVWFGGDTGYRTVPHSLISEETKMKDYTLGLDLPHCPVFTQIGELRGPFDLGLIPIGAYEPRYMFSPMHANPYDSLEIFLDTRCRRAMGIHWGTWVLTEEAVLDPPRLLREALRHKNMPEEGVFDVCEIGETREFPDERDV